MFYSQLDGEVSLAVRLQFEKKLTFIGALGTELAVYLEILV
jgi:hypothetical protein